MNGKYFVQAVLLSAVFAAATFLALVFFAKGVWRVQAAVFIQFVTAAVLVPYFFCGAEAEMRRNGALSRDVPGNGFRGVAAGAVNGLAASAGFILVSIPAVFAIQVVSGAADFGLLASGHLLIAAYAIFSSGLYMLLRPVLGALGAFAAASAVLLAFIAGPFWMNGFISSAEPHLRSWFLFIAIILNPTASAGSALFQLDLFRMKAPIPFYDLSNISDYSFAYPTLGETAGYWAVPGLVFGAVGLMFMYLKSRYRRGRTESNEPDAVENHN